MSQERFACVCVGEGNIPLASEGVTEEHAGFGLEH